MGTAHAPQPEPSQQWLLLCCRLRTQRSAGLFKQWDNVASAIRPLLELECDGECSIDWDAADAADVRLSDSAAAAGADIRSTSSGSGGGGGGSDSSPAADADTAGAGEVPEGCRLVMPTQASVWRSATVEPVKLPCTGTRACALVVNMCDLLSDSHVLPALQAEMSAAAGWQLVKAVHSHGGMFAVSRRLGVSMRNS